MPSITLQPNAAAGIDSFIYQGQVNDNYGAHSDIGVGQAVGFLYRGLLRFDLSSVPAGAVVTSATLTLTRVTGWDAVSRDITVHRALVEWYEGDAFGGAPSGDGSTWAHRNANGSAAWAGGAGGASGSDWETVPTDTTAVTGNGDYTWDVTADVAAWVAGSADNYGWVLNGPAVNSSLKWFSASDGGTAGDRPELEIVYVEGDIDGSAAGTGSAMGYAVGSRYAVGSAAGSAAATGRVYDLGSVEGSAAGSSSASGSVLGAERREGSAAGVATVAGHVKHVAWAEGDSAGQATVAGLGKTIDWAVGAAAGVGAATGRMWGWARAVRGPHRRQADPLLYLTDGESRFDLLALQGGLMACTWQPAVTLPKNGGVWNDSPLSDGRRLVLRRFANAIEVMEISGKARDQDELAAMLGDLLRWLERAAGYWTGRWAGRPIYLVAKAAYEQNARYAIIHDYSMPSLSDPYRAPVFHGARQGPELHSVILRLERGHWQDSMTDGVCVPIASQRNWTVADWTGDIGEGGGGTGIAGDIHALVETGSGAILAGTDDAGKIYQSSDDGDTWSLLATLGSSTDTVHSFAKDGAGRLYAAVTGSAGAQGIWRSTDHGASWGRVKTHPTGQGYRAVTFNRAASFLIAAGGPGASFSDSNLAVSAGGDGSVWSNVPAAGWAQSYIAAAADDYPYLMTAPAGKSPTGPDVFVGVDSYYTAAARVTRSGSGAAVTFLNSGAMGNGGLAMTAFAVTPSAGGVTNRALWAVRAAADTDDTEIWMWPAPAESGFPAADKFGRIATLADVNLTALYTDSTPSYDAAARTVWGGADGAIYVSLNSGYTWSLATEAPAGVVRAFLRTSGGRLLAGGDAGEVYIFGGSAGQGDTEAGGSSGGSRIITAQPLGAAATCEERTRLANKSAYSNLTHVFRYEGVVWTALQFDLEPPYSLLGNTPVSGNACYFGCRTDLTNVPAGPFSSLVFELSQAAEDLTLVWEYWDGAAWESLTVTDNSQGFRLTGVQSVHWAVPADWDTTAVNGVTGYWVRVRVDAVGSSPVGPIHEPVDDTGALREDAYIYAASLPFLEVAAADVGGDMPALARVIWRNQADGADLNLAAHRLVMGVRAVTRGPYFDAFLNLSDRQVPFGLTITDLGASGAFADAVRAPTGRAYAAAYTTGLSEWHDLVRLSLATTVAQDYYGDFRAFLRVKQTAGDADDWRLRLSIAFGSGGQSGVSSAAFVTAPDLDFALLDLGAVRIPSMALTPDLVGDALTLTVQGRPSASGVALTIYDLVLIPTDEWAGDFLHKNRSAGVASEVGGAGLLDVDSLGSPKNGLVAYNRAESGLVKTVYQAIANGEVALTHNTRQRLWMLAAAYDFTDGAWRADPEMVGSVRVRRVQRYLAWRGAR